MSCMCFWVDSLKTPSRDGDICFSATVSEGFSFSWIWKELDELWLATMGLLTNEICSVAPTRTRRPVGEAITTHPEKPVVRNLLDLASR